MHQQGSQTKCSATGNFLIFLIFWQCQWGPCLSFVPGGSGGWSILARMASKSYKILQQKGVKAGCYPRNQKNTSNTHQWDFQGPLIMGPYHSQSRIPKDMGIAWVPLTIRGAPMSLGVPGKAPLNTGATTSAPLGAGEDPKVADFGPKLQ